jgi:hypothetical protein
MYYRFFWHTRKLTKQAKNPDYLTIRSFLITHRRYGAEINGFSPDFSLKALFNVV